METSILPSQPDKKTRARLELAMAQSAGLPSSLIADYVFQPGGPGGGPANVFTTQAPLNAAIAKGRGKRTVLVDTTYSGGAATLAAASWSSVDEITLVGTLPSISGFTALTITGPISGVAEFVDVYVTYTGASSFAVVPPGDGKMQRWNNAFLAASAIPFYDATALGCVLVLCLGSDTEIGGNFAGIMCTTSALSFVAIHLLGNAFLVADSIEGPAASYFIMQAPNTSLSLTQAGITGTLSKAIWPVAPNSQTLDFFVVAPPIPISAFGLQQVVFAGNDFASMLAVALQGVPQLPKRVTIDTQALATITAGSYEWGGVGDTFNTEFCGTGDSQAALTFANGSSTLGVGKLTDLAITSQAAAGTFNMSYAARDVGAVYRLKNTSVTQTGGGDFVGTATPGTRTTFFLEEGSSFVSGTCLHISQAGAPASTLYIDGSSSVAINTLAVDAGCTLTVYVAPGGVCSPTQAGVAGTLTIIHEATPDVTFAQQAAQAAALTGDLFNPAGPGVAFIARTSTAIVHWTSTGQSDLATRQFQFALTCSGGAVVNGSAIQRAAPGGDAGFTVSCAGLVYLSGLTPGTSYTVRVSWAISGGAGTYTSNNEGTLTIHQPK
jgi:hypothetical protein